MQRRRASTLASIVILLGLPVSSTPVALAQGEATSPHVQEDWSPVGASLTPSSASTGPAAPIVALGNGDPAPGTSLRAQTADKPYSLTLRGSEERYEIRPGDHWPHDGDDTPRRRSELSGAVAPASGYAEFAYDLKVEPQPFADAVQYVFGQFHKGPRDLGDVSGDHPIVAFRLLTGGVPSLTVSGSDEKPFLVPPRSVEAWRGTPAEFRLGVWHHIQIKMNQGGPDSWCELWIDSAMKVHYRGEIGYPNRKPPYWKRGIYNAQASNEISVAYYRKVTLTLKPAAAEGRP